MAIKKLVGLRVSMNESGVHKSNMSHMWYGKRREIVTLPPCQAVKTATSLLVAIVVTAVLDKGFSVMIAGGGVIETCQENVDVSQGLVVIGVR